MLPQFKQEDNLPNERPPSGGPESNHAQGGPAERIDPNSSTVAERITGASEAARAREVGGTAPPEGSRRPVTPTQRRVLAFTWLSVFGMAVYAIFMVLAAFAPGYGIFTADRFSSFFLLAGLWFIMLHGLGYANSMIKASMGYNEVRRRAFSPQSLPKVACVIASFNEPAEVLEETVAALSNVDYPNKEVIILDDSTKEESRLAAREIAARYGATVRQRTNRRGYKAGAINDYLPTTDAQYLAVFDADALPAHNFLRDLVPIIDENPRLAFVQTPQYYANTEVSNVALAAHRQQAVFYEYICEGKSTSRAAFCCGTNVIFRRDALLDVGGFDETSVTEDFTTSLNLHRKGYDSAYYNQVYVYSLGPETLGAYFTQQSRWSFGSVGAHRRVLKNLLTSPASLRVGQWWEYYLSSSYYWIGWVNFIFMVLPMLNIFFGVKPLRADVFTYLMIFLPYMIFSLNMFYMGMEQRGYRVTDMLLGQQINFLCFPIHMSSAIAGILGLKRPFGVTPKGVSGRMSWLSLWPQLLMLFLSAFAFLWGMYRYFFTGSDRETSAIVINSIWCLYHVVLLSGLFRLNRSIAHGQTSPYFGRGTAVPANAGGAMPVGAVPAGATTGGGGLFAPAATGGRVITAPPQRAAGRLAFFIMLASLVVLLWGGCTIVHWYISPTYPVNVYVFDRTTGRDYQEHRALDWTLNFLKVHKDPTVIDPSGNGQHRATYDWASDFYGFIPGDPDQAKPDPIHQGDLLTTGTDRPLPETLKTPGVVDLADAYGEFVEYDYHKEQYVRYRNSVAGVDAPVDPANPQAPTGILPKDVDKIEDFYKRGGLLIGEWNSIGYPTLPGLAIDKGSLLAGIKRTQAGLQYLLTVELLTRQKDFARAQALYNSNQVANAEYYQKAQKNLKLTQAAIIKTKVDLVNLQQKAAPNSAYDKQLAAQRRLENMLRVHYLGWYGRYVDKFEQEHEYDFRLWKNVNDYIQKNPELKAKYPKGPVGPGFVFYRDGPSSILDPDTGKLEPNPFSEPFVILKDELGDVQTTDLARVYRTTKKGVEDDPLLADVATSSPCRFWFDVVRPTPGSTVLSYYKLMIKPSAAERLVKQGFPAPYLSKDKTQIVFPAAVASRDGDALHSFYFAGDASDYPLVSRMNEMFPATGGIAYFLGHRTGSFSNQYYWNYYEPIYRNIFETAKNARYTK